MAGVNGHGTCLECGDSKPLFGKGHCRRCYNRVTIACTAGCKRRTYDIRGACDACKGKGFVQCVRCNKWRKPYMQDHCRACARVVDFDCVHKHSVLHRGKCVDCFVEQSHYIKSYDSNNAVGNCAVCGQVSVNVKESGATCQQWTNFQGRARNYGLSPETLRDLYIRSQGGCSICGDSEGETAFAVDHDHACCPSSRSCGKCVRNLLCRRCNTVLGMCEDSVPLLEWMVSYLQNPSWKEL